MAKRIEVEVLIGGSAAAAAYTRNAEGALSTGIPLCFAVSNRRAAGLVTVPREPTDGVVLAGVKAAGVKKSLAFVIFRAMIVAADDDGVPLASFAQ